MDPPTTIPLPPRALKYVTSGFAEAIGLCVTPCIDNDHVSGPDRLEHLPES